MPPAGPHRTSERTQRLAQLREALVKAAGNAHLVAELRAEIAALARKTPPEFTRMGVELEAIVVRLQRVNDNLTEIATALNESDQAGARTLTK